MLNRPKLLCLALATALTLTACGGDDDAASTTTVAPERAVTTEAPSGETTTPSAPDTAPSTSADSSGDAAALESCETWITADEIDAILGTTVTVSGSTKTCNMTFSDDAIGSFQALDGAKKDQAIDELITPFIADPSDGVVLEGDRGFVTEVRAVVIGDSGTVFLFDVPSGMDFGDGTSPMQQVADLLLTR